MPLTTYVAGDVLTALSLNDNFTFAASNPPGGLALITTGTITAAASVTVDGCFTATFDEYVLKFDVLSSVVQANLIWQMRNAGSTITAANYQTARSGHTNTNAADNAGVLAQTSWLFGFSSTISPSVCEFQIYDPVGSTQQTHTAIGSTRNAADSAQSIYTFSFRYGVSQAFDGFIITQSTGNMTGTVRVYGMAK